jgi:hypothetical protein
MEFVQGRTHLRMEIRYTSGFHGNDLHLAIDLHFHIRMIGSDGSVECNSISRELE